MKQSIISKVVQCAHCKSYYVEGVEGDNGTCDECIDIPEQENSFDPYDTFIENPDD